MKYPTIPTSELWKGQVIPHGGDTYQVKITSLRRKTMNDFKIGDKVITKYNVDYKLVGTSQTIHSVVADKKGIVSEVLDPDSIMVDFEGVTVLIPALALKHLHPRKRFSLTKFIHDTKYGSSIVLAQQIKLWAYACDGLEAEWSGVEEAGQYQVRHPESGCCYKVEPEWCWDYMEEKNNDN